jgi:transcriptional regulator with XRE-family HTH domain
MRKERHMTIKGLAGYAGMSKDYLQKTESKGCNLSWDMLAGLAEGLGTSISYIAASAEQEARDDRAAAGSVSSPLDR